MNKSISKISLILLAAILLGSCAKSKLKDAVEILNDIPVFITNEKVNQKITLEDNTITIQIPDQGQLTDEQGNQVSDDKIPAIFLRNLFNSSITSLILGEKVGTEKGGSPTDEFLSLAENQKAKFVIEYKGKKTELTPDQVKEILKSKDI